MIQESLQLNYILISQKHIKEGILNAFLKTRITDDNKKTDFGKSEFVYFTKCFDTRSYITKTN